MAKLLITLSFFQRKMQQTIHNALKQMPVAVMFEKQNGRIIEMKNRIAALEEELSAVKKEKDFVSWTYKCALNEIEKLRQEKQPLVLENEELKKQVDTHKNIVQAQMTEIDILKTELRTDFDDCETEQHHMFASVLSVDELDK